jgi:hypothetical protein
MNTLNAYERKLREMPRERPEFYAPEQLEELVVRLQSFTGRVLGIKDVMIQNHIPGIEITSRLAYDRAIEELKRWSRAAEDGLDQALRPSESPKPKKSRAKP